VLLASALEAGILALYPSSW